MNIKKGDIISNTNHIGGIFYLCYKDEWQPCNFSYEKQFYYVIKSKNDGYNIVTLELMNLKNCNGSIRVSGHLYEWDKVFEHVVES